MTSELLTKLSDWLRDEVASGGGKGVVLGISGGIDSAVASYICREAFPDDFLGLVIPCYSNKTDTDDAKYLAKKMGIKHETVDIDNVYSEFLVSLSHMRDDRDISLANIKPRLRMSVLYYYANRLGYFVVGAANKSELTLGYFTKHGDGGCDILPIGNLTKRSVYALARSLKVPQRIFNKPPSAGLWRGQTDEGELGVSYQEIDNYLEGKTVSLDVKKKIEDMIRSTEHKRRMPKVPDF